MEMSNAHLPLALTVNRPLHRVYLVQSRTKHYLHPWTPRGNRASCLVYPYSTRQTVTLVNSNDQVPLQKARGGPRHGMRRWDTKRSCKIAILRSIPVKKMKEGYKMQVDLCFNSGCVLTSRIWPNLQPRTWHADALLGYRVKCPPPLHPPRTPLPPHHPSCADHSQC